MHVRLSLKTGFGFGLTSGIITTLGLIVGLNAGTHSKVTVIGGILTIAIADAFSDALGIHVSQESQNRNSSKSVWEATFATLLSKFVVALSFVGPFICCELPVAVAISLVWGFSLLAVFSFIIAKQKEKNPGRMVAEHMIIALAVILITNFASNQLSFTFPN